ncbi:MAG: ATPase, partial [Burkholderiales bacterium]|nr:ATPase [Opitutaceae bacterium]
MPRLRLSEPAYARVERLLDLSLLLCGLLTLGLFVLVVGFPLPGDLHEAVTASTRGILALFAFQELLRFALAPRPLVLLRARRVEALIALAAGLELAFGHILVFWLQRIGSGLSPTTIALLYLGGTQLTLLASLALRAIRDNRWLCHRTLSPGLVFILSFTALITLGTLLFKLPHATHAGISWVDAIFVATSAVCVTGLSPVDVPATFTQHGQWVLLGLIQVGGLGIMTLTYFFAYFVAGGVSLRNRIGLQDLLSEENLGHIGTVLALIVAFTAGVELLGAGIIYSALNDAPAAPENLPFFALFHAVSAFCNAGFSTLSAGLADPSVNDHTGFLSVIMILIVLGGLGLPVIKNFWHYAVAVVHRRLGRRLAAPPRLTANSRIVLITTAILLVGGTVLMWCTEFAFSRAPGHIAADSTWFTALFHSVTARTAGFNVTPVAGLLPATAALMMFLMFVGGSPSSTAGGIKTSTLAVALLSLRRILFGRRDVEAFGRRLPEELGDRALSILVVAGGFVTTLSVILCTLHPELPPEDLVFEVVSAVGTV